MSDAPHLLETLHHHDHHLDLLPVLSPSPAAACPPPAACPRLLLQPVSLLKPTDFSLLQGEEEAAEGDQESLQ